MKTILLQLLKKIVFLFAFFPLVVGCEKEDIKNEPTQISEGTLNENTIIVTDLVYPNLVSVQENTIVFLENEATANIKIGSILVSDMSQKAPDGFLRKVTNITTSAGQKICTTEQASLTDALTSARVKFQKTFTDADLLSVDSNGLDIAATNRGETLSLNRPFSGLFGGVSVNGKIDIVAGFDFDLKIEKSEVNLFKAELDLTNTNEINIEAKAQSEQFSEQRVLATYSLAPFTIYIGLVPFPIAKQWLVLVMGVDGKIEAKCSTGATNVNTIKAGIQYTKGSGWNTIQDNQNSFYKKPIDFEGKAKVEAWLQTRYEIRPYALKQSRIFLAARGSAIAEIKTSNQNLCLFTTSLDWSVQLSGKAQMFVFDKTVVDYEEVYYSKIFPVFKKDVSSLKAETTNITEIIKTIDPVTNQTTFTAKSGGFLRDSIMSCNTQVLERGVCWDTLKKPTLDKSKTSDGTNIGSYVSNLTKLKGGKKYYVRAFAKTEKDTIYGKEKEFETPFYIKIVFLSLITHDDYYNNKLIEGIRFSYASQNIALEGGNFKDCITSDYYPIYQGSLIADISRLSSIKKITAVMYDNCGNNCSKMTICNNSGLIEKISNGNIYNENITKVFDVLGKDAKTFTFSSYEGYLISLEIE